MQVIPFLCVLSWMERFLGMMSKNSCPALLYYMKEGGGGGFLGGALEWFQRSHIIVMPCLCTDLIRVTSNMPILYFELLLSVEI